MLFIIIVAVLFIIIAAAMLFIIIVMLFIIIKRDRELNKGVNSIVFDFFINIILNCAINVLIGFIIAPVEIIIYYYYFKWVIITIINILVE